MDKTSQLFNRWAKIGRSEEMEKGHGTTVNKFFDKLIFNKPFTFLDIGCGNGWVVRKISQLSNCKKAIGIDKSSAMIKKAKDLATHEKDTGSSEVQIALLTEKIDSLSKHVKQFKKDKHTSVGLLKAVNRRKKLLDYLKKYKIDSYKNVLTKLNLRK